MHVASVPASPASERLLADIMKNLRARCNFWIERDDQVVLSGWRVSLLEAVAETGSISAAATRMDIPYRVAWRKIKEMEEGLGIQLTESTVGGVGGGGTRLTPAAHEYLHRFHQFSDGLKELVEQRFEEAFQNEG